MPRAMTKDDFQNKIDKVYGEGEWKVDTYTGNHKPLVIVHKCGKEKRLSRASTFTSGGKDKCTDCNKENWEKNGRPKLTFKELSDRIEEATYGTYELVKLIDSTEFVVNHKSCDRKPFTTSISRFFSREQRCQCAKIGVVGRKPGSEVTYCE
ncbi:MAG: hypothetical protein RRZ84_02735 [Romboutsia sp.]